MRSNVDFVKDHVRHLVFTNAGTVPLYINKITIDGTNNKKCRDFWEILKVVNCNDLIGRRISPNTTI